MAKVRAAVKARAGTDTQIIARTDAMAPLGIDEAIARGHRFADAGADVLFIEAPQSRAHLERIGKSFDIPLLVNVIVNSVTPVLTPTDYRQVGFQVAIYSALTIAAVAASVQHSLATLRDNTVLPDDAMNPKQLFDLVGLDEWLTWPEGIATARL